MTTSKFPADLQAEIDYRLDLYQQSIDDGTGDEVPLTGDLLLQVILQDIESAGAYRGWKHAILDWYLERGIYVTVTPEQYASVVLSHGSKARLYPVHRGQIVTFDKWLS